jgi:antitoxin FitA
MAHLIMADLDQVSLQKLRERAALHGRTPEAEAKNILAEALVSGAPDAWSWADTIRQQLAASGRTFSDSAELLREDRDR